MLRQHNYIMGLYPCQGSHKKGRTNCAPGVLSAEILLHLLIHVALGRGELANFKELGVDHLDSQSVHAVYAAGAIVYDVGIHQALLSEGVFFLESCVLEDRNRIVEITLPSQFASPQSGVSPGSVGGSVGGSVVGSVVCCTSSFSV